MKSKLIPALAIAASFYSISSAQNITTIGYGVNIDVSEGSALFLSSSGTGFNNGQALVSIGFFDGASTFDNWVSFSSTSTFSPVPGLVTTAEVIDLGATVPTVTPMLAIFEGISNPADIGSFSGNYALISDSSWDPIAGAVAPAPPPASEYRVFSFDTISVGQVVIGAGFNGGDGIQVVPEPTTYAMLAGIAALAFVAIRRRK